MNKRDPQSRYPPPPQAAPQQSRGALDEAQALFERMKGEVMRPSEREREEARSRGMFTRLLLLITIVACVLAAATMLYGIYNFPDAPIRQANGGYVGKGGKPHTRDDFDAFILWGKAMLVVVPSVFVFGFAFVVADSRQRRKRAASKPEARKE